VIVEDRWREHDPVRAPRRRCGVRRPERRRGNERIEAELRAVACERRKDRRADRPRRQLVRRSNHDAGQTRGRLGQDVAERQIGKIAVALGDAIALAGPAWALGHFPPETAARIAARSASWSS